MKKSNTERPMPPKGGKMSKSDMPMKPMMNPMMPDMPMMKQPQKGGSKKGGKK